MKVTVLGAGSWGSALAKHFADQGYSTRLWARREEQAEEIQTTRINGRYLPDLKMPDTLSATSDLERALSDAEIVVSVVPSQTTRAVWAEARDFVPKGVPILCASKGIENDTLDMMVTVLENVVPGHPIGFIGGPSFAKEVAGHMPTAVVIAAKDHDVAQRAQELMSCEWLRAYSTEDVVGVEIGGALKNVIAIACGCADGLGLGLNSRAALITRGLAEITRVAVKMGANPLTLAGLAGMGDLVLTCTGDLSRNRRVGLGLGEGKKLQQILDEMGQVAEGVKTTLSARDLSEKVGVEMPITQQVYAILYEDKPAKEVVRDLMMRDLKREHDH